MVATRLLRGVVNQGYSMFAAKEVGSCGYAQYEVTYLPVKAGSGGDVPCYMVCVPLALIHPVKEYLSKSRCKFTGRASTDRERAEFFVEVIPPTVLDRLVESTLRNGGRVDLNAVQYNIVEREDEPVKYLNVTFKGQCIQDMCCSRPDDFYSHVEFNSTFTKNDILDIRTAIFTAVERSQGTLVVGYDTRICLDIAELFMEYGFVSVPEDECLVLRR